MKEIKVKDIENPKKETLGHYYDQLWNLANIIDERCKNIEKEKDKKIESVLEKGITPKSKEIIRKEIYQILFDYSSELQGILCDMNTVLEIKLKIR